MSVLRTVRRAERSIDGNTLSRLVSRFVPLLLASLSFVACVNDPGLDPRTVTVNSADLPPLETSEGHYELWFSYPDDVAGKVAHGDAQYVSLGRFVVNDEGKMRALDGGEPSFAIPDGYLPGLLIDGLLTIESPGDADSLPGARLLGGAFSGTADRGVATLTFAGEDAFGVSFSADSIAGSFRLTTPTSAGGDDDAQGIWFVTPTGSPALTLPNLAVNADSTNWGYVAWLYTIGQGSYLPLGFFLAPGRRDDTDAGPGAGPFDNPFNAPGEDFVAGTPRILNDGTYGVMLSLQPRNLSLSRPFYTLLTHDTIMQGASTELDFPLGSVRTPRPEIEVVINRE